MSHVSNSVVNRNFFAPLSDSTNTWRPKQRQDPIASSPVNPKRAAIFSILQNREIQELLPFFSDPLLKNGAIDHIKIEKQILKIERRILTSLPENLRQNNHTALKDRFVTLLKTAYDYSLVQAAITLPNPPKARGTIYKKASIFCQWLERCSHQIENFEVDESQGLLCIPKELFQLPLKRLSICHTRLTSLSPQIGNLKNLEELILTDNRLTTLPHEITKLTALTSLDISKNRFQSLPKEIGTLPALRTLNAGSNLLDSFSITNGAFKNLEKLDLSDNHISILPNNIRSLTRLQELTLFLNNIWILPWDIGDLQSLTVLDLHSNRFESLPATAYGLKNLKRLDLGNNPIKSIPKAIQYLKQLEQLGLAHTPYLHSLPLQIAPLPCLQRLDLDNDQLMHPELRGKVGKMKKRAPESIQTEIKKRMLEEKKKRGGRIPPIIRY